MSVRNAHWYNLNETRSYPLADEATEISDAGERMPSDIVTDLNLRFPDSLGRYAFFGSVAVTSNLVSVTLQAADDPDAIGTLTPLAVFSIAKSDLIQGRQYSLQAQMPGVGGWIVLGSGVDELYSGRFSVPRQALLAPRAARTYPVPPVTSLGKLHRTPAMTGIVTLRAVDPLQIVAEEREIDGVLRDAIVIRLVQPESPLPELSELDTNVFELFSGPCNARPESETCGNPEPIEAINIVPPDCDGNITIVFRGCAAISEVVQECGIVLDCDLNLSEVCLPDRLPDADGTLPNEYEDQCSPTSDSLVEISESIDPDPETSEESETSESPQTGHLPYNECFDDGMANYWDVKSGSFVFNEDEDSPAEPADCDPGPGTSYSTEGSASSRNVSVWEGFDTTALNRRAIGDVKLLLGPAGAKHNAGIVFNYRPHPTIPSRSVYYLAEIDLDDMEFRVRRFNGTSFVPIASASVLGLAIDEWFNIDVQIDEVDADDVSITAVLTGVDTPAVSASLGPFLDGNYLPADGGDFGVHANRAESLFSYVRVEEAS